MMRKGACKWPVSMIIMDGFMLKASIDVCVFVFYVWMYKIKLLNLNLLTFPVFLPPHKKTARRHSSLLYQKTR